MAREGRRLVVGYILFANGCPNTPRASKSQPRLTWSRPLRALAEEVLNEWRKASKHDAAVRIASALSTAGKEGVEEAYVASPAFHEAWKEKARLVLARSEWRRRKLTKRVDWCIVL